MHGHNVLPDGFTVADLAPRYCDATGTRWTGRVRASLPPLDCASARRTGCARRHPKTPGPAPNSARRPRRAQRRLPPGSKEHDVCSIAIAIMVLVMWV